MYEGSLIWNGDQNERERRRRKKGDECDASEVLFPSASVKKAGAVVGFLSFNFYGFSAGKKREDT